jgi:hypothetical protein
MMNEPADHNPIRRIQLSRRAGWRKPPDAVVVSRPSVYGNPFTVRVAMDDGHAATAADARAICVEAFREWVDTGHQRWLIPNSAARRDRLLGLLPALAGRTVACWCPLAEPCHGDVLLALANPEFPTTPTHYR